MAYKEKARKLCECRTESLRKELKGVKVLTSDSEGYEESLRRWAESAEKRAGAVVLCKTAEDVSATITFARTHNVELVVCGGGHSTSGASSSDGGIVVDLSEMNQVTVDPIAMTISAGGGSVWKDVDDAAADYGLAAVGGTVNHTGIGGLTLGGGYGYLSGRYGLAIDNLVRAKVVKADSEIVTASTTENPDLFWAIRGAGASFGAVVEFVYRAHVQRSTVWAGRAAFPLSKLPQVVKFANDFAAAKNPDATLNFGFACPPNAPGPMLVTIGFYNGYGLEGKKIFGPLLDAGPVFQNFGPLPYCKANSLLNETAGHGGRKIIGGAACAAPFSVDFYSSIKDELLNFIKEVPAAKSSLLIFELVPHTKIHDLDPEGTGSAFANRGPYFNAVCMTKWENEQDDGKCREFTRLIRKKISANVESVAPNSVGKYTNYNDLADTRTDGLLGSHEDKLMQLKMKYDPRNIFNKWGDISTHAIEHNHGYHVLGY